MRGNYAAESGGGVHGERITLRLGASRLRANTAAGADGGGAFVRNSTVAWSDGVRDPQLLCHLLFGVATDAAHGPPSVRFRCSCCHNRCLPHYDSLRARL